MLKFTPLEFKTSFHHRVQSVDDMLKFTPLEFKTIMRKMLKLLIIELKFTPLEFKTCKYHCRFEREDEVKIYSVGV